MDEFKNCKVCNGDITIENKKYNLGKCDSCKLVFCLSVFSQNDFINVYDELYNRENSAYQRHSNVEYNNLLTNKKIKIGYKRSKLVKANILNKNCSSVLEIGSGIGLLGVYLRSKNDKIKYTGVEIDKEAFEKSQEFKLNTINGDFSAMRDLGDTFDVIMLWEVIEHLHDLKMFLELAYSKLNVDGKVILSTPNYHKIFNYPRRKSDQLFQDEPPIHLNFFTEENIANVFKNVGFAECKVQIKKFPYLDIYSKRFYKDMFKSFMGKYNGATLYVKATK